MFEEERGHLKAPLLKVGLLQWNQFDSIVRQGEQHAREVLEQQAAATAQNLKPCPPLAPIRL